MQGVRALARRAIAAAEVSRLPVAFGAIANVWLMVLLARTEAARAGDGAASDSAVLIASLSPALALVASGAFAVGLLAFGATLNDLLDAKRDAAFAPERPIPSGSLSPRRALHLALAALTIGLLGSLAFGTSAIAGAFALTALILAYDAFAKHVPALGIVLAGLTTAASMLALTFDSPSLVPVWLAMSQTMGVGLAAYLVADKRPRLSRRAVLLGALGWLFWSGVLFALAAYHNGPTLVPSWYEEEKLIVPAATVLGCAAFGLVGLRRLRGPSASERLLRYASLWKTLVAASWLLVVGRVAEAAWLAGIGVALALLFALLREAGPQVAAPVSWRS